MLAAQVKQLQRYVPDMRLSDIKRYKSMLLYPTVVCVLSTQMKNPQVDQSDMAWHFGLFLL